MGQAGGELAGRARSRVARAPERATSTAQGIGEKMAGSTVLVRAEEPEQRLRAPEKGQA